MTETFKKKTGFDLFFKELLDTYTHVEIWSKWNCFQVDEMAGAFILLLIGLSWFQKRLE